MNQDTTRHSRSRPLAPAPPAPVAVDAAAGANLTGDAVEIAMQPARNAGAEYQASPLATAAGYRVVLSCASGPGGPDDERPLSKGSRR